MAGRFVMKLYIIILDFYHVLTYNSRIIHSWVDTLQRSVMEKTKSVCSECHNIRECIHFERFKVNGYNWVDICLECLQSAQQMLALDTATPSDNEAALRK